MLRVEKARGCGKMLHGCPQFSGLSLKKIILIENNNNLKKDPPPLCFRRLLVRSGPLQRAARRFPKGEKPGGVADSGF